MNIFQKFINKKQEETIIEKTEKGFIYAPMDGEVIPLKEINDGVFSEEMLGKGCGIKPTDGKLYAPFDGEIVLIIETKHAIALKSCDGIELLIHIGMDTVKMNGKGFNPLVKVGEKIKCGQSLMTFSISDIEKAGYVTTTAIVVTNSDQYRDIEVLAQGHRKKSEKLIKIL
jgi:glucose-specific phosphotransferase system IIA component